MVELQDGKVMLTQMMMMEVLLIAVAERIHHDGFHIELLFSLRHVIRFYTVKNIYFHVSTHMQLICSLLSFTCRALEDSSDASVIQHLMLMTKRLCIKANDVRVICIIHSYHKHYVAFFFFGLLIPLKQLGKKKIVILLASSSICILYQITVSWFNSLSKILRPQKFHKYSTLV